MVDPPYRLKNMMPGMIMLWYGSIESIPSGWTLCDGSMDTPDLRGYFVRGAGPSHAPGASGGSNSHTHSFTGDGHSHTIPAGAAIAAGSDFSSETESDPALGTTDIGYNVPACKNLCYIMKL
jgi:hypothetical protein